MTTSTLAILVSCLSLVISGIALGWNIYKDVYLRARVRTKFRLMISYPENVWRYCITTTNLGPGKVKLEMLALADWSIWKKITRSCREAFLHHNYENLPCDLDVGQVMNVTFDPDDCTFLTENYTHIGISDSFGRIHWCNKRDMVNAKKAFRDREWAKKEE